MDPIELPTPPPLPPGPVPQTWGPWTEEGRALERRHRLAVLHGACERCADPPDGPSRTEWIASLARPRHPDDAESAEARWTTPEGEIASFSHGRFVVDDRNAFEAWAYANFTRVGDAFAHVVEVAGEPWTRALFWFAEEGVLHLETSSLDRAFHLQMVFEHLWPPVFRAMRLLSPLDDRLDAPFRPHWPAPPAEASAFTRLVPPIRPRMDSEEGHASMHRADDEQAARRVGREAPP